MNSLSDKALIRIANKLANIPDKLIVREKDWFYPGSEILQQNNPGKVYRGMTKQEFDNTVGQGKEIKSTGQYSTPDEGTCFSDDPATAESYVNYGRDNPIKTQSPNYLIEVTKTETMFTDSDGYVKDKNPVPFENITGVWEFSPDEENPDLLVMLRIQ